MNIRIYIPHRTNGIETMNRILAAMAAATLLGGCATSATPLSEARPVPEDRMRAAPAVASAEPATCVFVRDTGFVGSGSFVDLSIDELPAALIATGETVRITVDPGERLFSALLHDPFGLNNPVVLAQNVRPGGTYVYRLATDQNGTVTFIRSLSERADRLP